MHGDARIIDILNQVLRKELTGINQYFIHSRAVLAAGVLVSIGVQTLVTEISVLMFKEPLPPLETNG